MGWESGLRVKSKGIDGGWLGWGGWGGFVGWREGGQNRIEGESVEISMLGGDSMFNGPSHSQCGILPLKN